jgi:hypothetical protein
VLSYFLTDRSLENVRTIHSLFEGRFEVCQKGWEDGLRTTLADFFRQVGGSYILYFYKKNRPPRTRG